MIRSHSSRSCGRFSESQKRISRGLDHKNLKQHHRNLNIKISLLEIQMCGILRDESHKKLRFLKCEGTAEGRKKMLKLLECETKMPRELLEENQSAAVGGFSVLRSEIVSLRGRLAKAAHNIRHYRRLG